MKKSKSLKKDDLIVVKPFHKTFPYGLSWTTQFGKKTLEHFAYFPYDDYRTKYIEQYKRDGGKRFKKFRTKPRDTVD